MFILYNTHDQILCIKNFDGLHKKPRHLLGGVCRLHNVQSHPCINYSFIRINLSLGVIDIPHLSGASPSYVLPQVVQII